MATRVYQYGLRAPRAEDMPRIEETISGAHRYYNVLIEIERERRAAYRAARSDMDAGLAAIEAEMVGLTAQIDTIVADARGARQRSRTRGPRGDTEALAALRAQRREVAARMKAARSAAAASPELVAASAAIDERAHERRLAARAACGVYWGTYLLVEAAVQAACTSATSDPAFARWAWGAGRIGVQIQGGIEAGDLADDTRLQIVDAPAPAQRYSKSGVALPMPGAARLAERKVLRMRVGSEGRDPVWAEWPMIMHRPLPEGARIMGAVVHRRVDANGERWCVDLTLRLPDRAPTRPTTRVVAVDHGWRKLGDEIRVAYWRDSDGRGGELRIGADVLDRLSKAESIRGFRDRDRDAMLPRLVEALRGLTLPEWATRATEALSQWRSMDRLHRLHAQWRDARWDGDAEAYAILDAWHLLDGHLWRYEHGVREGALRHRREVYRLFAARLAREYGAVIMEREGTGRMARLPAPELPPEANAPRRQRVQAAAAELRSAISNAMWREGGRVVEVEAAYTTRTCHLCGTVHETAIETVEHTCVGCGAAWDQDANAASNILASGVAVLRDREALAALDEARKPRAARFAKRHKARSGEVLAEQAASG